MFESRVCDVSLLRALQLRVGQRPGMRGNTSCDSLAVLVESVGVEREIAVELLQFAQKQVRGFALQVRENVVFGEDAVVGGCGERRESGSGAERERRLDTEATR